MIKRIRVRMPIRLAWPHFNSTLRVASHWAALRMIWRPGPFIAVLLLMSVPPAVSAVATSDQASEWESALANVEGGQRLSLLVNLTEHYRVAAPLRALDRMQEGLVLARRGDNAEAEAELLCHGAWAQRVLGDYPSALSLSAQGLRLSRDRQLKHAQARCLNSAAGIETVLGNYAEALDGLNDALVIEEELHHVEHISGLYNNIGFVHVALKHYNEAISLLNRAGEMARTLGDEVLLAYVLTNTAEAYLYKAEPAHALPLLEQAFIIRERDGNPGTLAYNLHFLGVTFSALAKYPEASARLNRALQLRREIGDRDGSASTLKVLAEVARKQKQFGVANEMLLEAESIARVLNNSVLLRDILRERQQSLASQGLYKEALAAASALEPIERKLFDEQAAMRLAQLQARLDDVQRLKQIESLTKENEIQRLRSDRQLSFLYVAAASAVLLITWVLVLVWRSRNRRLIAEAAVQARSRYLAQMSHEIRTPMTGIIGVSELLAESSLSVDQKDLVNTIHHSGESLLSLINDILDLSKLDAGKLQLHNRPFDVRHLLESVLDLFAVSAEKKQIQLTGYIGLKSPVLASGDEMRLRQILVNLIGNALKFTERGQVCVDISMRTSHGEDIDDGSVPANTAASLHISIRDTGVGMNAEQQLQLFEPFAQVDHRREWRSKGTGLGLAISRQLARLMGGDIRVISEPGTGSEFIVDCRVQLLTDEIETGELPVPVRRLHLAYVQGAHRDWLTRLASDWGMEVITHALTEPVSADNQFTRTDAVFIQMDAQNLPSQIAMVETLSKQGVRVILLATPALRANLREHKLDGVLLNLPLRLAAVQAALSSAPSIAPAVVVAPVARLEASPHKRALVVDDNEVNRKVAAKLLEKLGFQALAVDGAYRALAETETAHFAVVLMDCQMPDMDGYEATRVIRAREAKLHAQRHLIIAVTANAMKGDREKCLAAGMDDYIAKPMKMETLVDTLRRWQVLERV